AGLFQQAKVEQFVLDNLWHDLLRIMAELIHLPVDTPPEQLIFAVNRLTGKEYQPILKLYSASGGLSQKLSLKQFLMIASKLDAYRKEFLAWKKSSPFVNR
ncbi:MAG TPA: hypothetical protein DDW50_04825, partial [Firmicutes bacterium]|nr:hypothetical protein [Bacillota bacterium]